MLAPGTALSRYVVESPIGSGGMGAVYRARDTHLDRAVALKVLSDGAGGVPDQEARDRLVREARAAAALSHPNAVSIYDAGDSEHGPFIVMELVEGETLRAAIARGASVEEILGWMKMAALALGEAHERGIVHRDIKPENLMLRRDGIAKVLDFGIARQTARGLDESAPTHAALPTLTGTGVQIGTPQYMAPEQIKGKKLDGRTDQFAWAVTTYEALAGRLPWQAQNGALGVVASILEEVPDNVSNVRPGVPAHVGAVIAKAMQKRPEDRFASMRDLVRALDGLPAGESAGGGRPSSFEADPSRVVHRPPPAPARPEPLRPETRFSEATVRAVIGKALAFEEQGGYSKSELKQAAGELAISESALEDAVRAIRADKQRSASTLAEEPIRQRILRQRRKGFIAHLIPYIGVNLIILMPALMKDMQGKVWALFVPAIAWGIGLAIHAMKAFSNHIEPWEIRRELEREERSIAKDAARRSALAERLERRGRRNRMKQNAVELGGAVEEGVASIMAVAAQKIREGAERANAHGQAHQPGARVRVGQSSPPPSYDSELIRAEAEAEAEAEVQRGRGAR